MCRLYKNTGNFRILGFIMIIQLDVRGEPSVRKNGT